MSPDQGQEGRPATFDDAEVVRQGVKKEIQEAKKGGIEEETALANKLLKELSNRRTDAKEVRDIADRTGGLQIDLKKSEAIKVRLTLVRVLEGIKEGIIKPPQKSKIILTELANRGLTDATASYLHEFVERYKDNDISISDRGQDKTAFENEFDVIRSRSPSSAQILGEVLINKAHELGKNIDLMKEKFEVSDEETPTQQSGQRTAQEEARFKELKLEINEKLNESFVNQSLTPQERSKAIGVLNGFPDSEGSAALQRIGIAQTKLNEYIGLFNKIFVRTIDLGLMKQYAPGFASAFERAQEEFNIKNLNKNFLQHNSSGNLVLDSDGRVKFTRDSRLKFQEIITKYYYEALKNIHQDKSKQFQQSMGNSIEYQYYFGGIRQIITKACTDFLKNNFQDNPDVEAFLKDKATRYQSSIMTYAQILHDLPLYAKSAAQFEKWGEFLGNLFPSELAEVFDEGDRFMQMARDEITMYIRKRLVTYKETNQYPSDLVSGQYDQEGVRWGLKFEEDIRKILKTRVAELNRKLKSENKPLIDLGEDDWKLDRALTYASGIGIANLVDIEVMATADPKGNFEGVHPLLAVLSGRANWQAGRGDPNSGIISRYLLKMDVELFPEMRGFIPRLFNKKDWVPKKFADMVDKQAKMYGESVLGELFDKGGSYQELLSMINIATSLISRHGWRMRPLKDELKGIISKEQELRLDNNWKEWTKDQWKMAFDTSLAEYGNASLWWFLTSGPDRLTNEMKRLLVKQLGGDIDKTDYEFREYSTGKKMLDKDFDFDVMGDVRRMNYLEVRNMRMGQLRGETFFRYMRRNPGDFFLLMTQLAPDIVDDDGFVFMEEAEMRNAMQNPQDKSKRKTDLDVEKMLAKRSELVKRWGPEHIKKLGEVNAWIKAAAGGKDIKKFVSILVEQSGTAFERIMNENAPIQQEIEQKRKELDKATDKTEQDRLKAEIKALTDRRRTYLKKEDFIEGELFEKIYDTDGLSKILTGKDFDHLDDFYENFGDFDIFGKDNVFYRMGLSWTHRQGDVNPFSSDFNHFAVYKHLGEVGEDVPARYLGDAEAVKKVVQETSQLEQLLSKAADGGNFEKIYELHEKMFWTLKNIIGDEYAQRANYILASIVTQFFYEHSATRQPFLRFPFDLPIRGLIGKEVSLSKLLTGNRHAYSMDENAARTYFRKLSYDMHVIPNEGAWSNEQLEAAFDAKSDTFIFGDVIPSIGYFLIMFLLWTYIKKAIEESEGKKQQ